MLKTIREFGPVLLWGVAGLLFDGVIAGVVGVILEKFLPEGLPDWGWWLLVLGALLVACFKAYHDVRVQRDELRARLDAVSDEYAHGLSLESINYDSIDGFTFTWKNTTSRALAYEMTNVRVDGKSPTNFLTRGGVIAASAQTQFHSGMRASIIGGQLAPAVVEIAVRYGSPNKMIREMAKIARVNFSGDRLTYTYELDTDIEIGGHDLEKIR